MMVEASSYLNLEKIVERTEKRKLVPFYKKKPIITRPTSLIFLVSIIISAIGLLNRVLIDQSIIFMLFFFIVAFGYIRKIRIDGIYEIIEDGLKIPYGVFRRRTIFWDQIIDVINVEIIEKISNKEYSGLRFEIDTNLLRFNTSGMEAQFIQLSTMDYNNDDLKQFKSNIQVYRDKSITPPNTQAKRLTDQVNRSWVNRYRLISLNVFDSSTEAIFILLLFEGIIYGIFTINWHLIASVLLFCYIFIVIVIQLLDKPSAIIGIRPHELGPLLYDDVDVTSKVRFIIMSRPFTIQLISCDIIHDEKSIVQISKLKQIYPKKIEPGILTHGVAEIYGNHSKAIGAKIRFIYVERKNDDIIYEIEIYWS